MKKKPNTAIPYLSSEKQPHFEISASVWKVFALPFRLKKQATTEPVSPKITYPF